LPFTEPAQEAKQMPNDMSPEDQQIAIACGELKDAISDTINEIFSEGVNPYVLSYVGCDMAAQGAMALYGNGHFETFEEALDSCMGGVRAAMEQYQQAADPMTKIIKP
jgi:hypothetical protein